MMQVEPFDKRVELLRALQEMPTRPRIYLGSAEQQVRIDNA